MIIICPNSQDKLTKVKLGQVEVSSNIAQNYSSSPYEVVVNSYEKLTKSSIVGIAFKRVGGYSKCRHECSCSSARRVSNFNTNIPLGDIYPPIKLYYDVLGIDNV